MGAVGPRVGARRRAYGGLLLVLCVSLFLFLQICWKSSHTWSFLQSKPSLKQPGNRFRSTMSGRGAALFRHMQRARDSVRGIKSKVYIQPLENWGLVPNNDKGTISIPILPKLKNRYFALRDGESTANERAVISSNYLIGSTKHGLTDEGVIQARQAASALLEAVGREGMKELIVYSSNFTRARDTALECVEAARRIMEYESLGMPTKEYPILIDDRLNERNFGELDTTSVTNYNYVWPLDLYDAKHTAFGVESVEEVVKRVQSLVLGLETIYRDKNILLVSHADTLQIMQCYIAQIDPRLFSQYRFENAELRRLIQDANSLPAPAPLCMIAPASEIVQSAVLPGANLQKVDENPRSNAPGKPGAAGMVQSLTQLSELYVAGHISAEEFAEAKKKVIEFATNEIADVTGHDPLKPILSDGGVSSEAPTAITPVYADSITD